MKKVIIVNGSAGVGKNTLIDFCKEYCEVSEFDSVGKEKALALLAGWDGVKDENGRQLLRAFKQARINYGDLPTKDAHSAIVQFLGDDTKEILFLHIREDEEMQKIKNVFPDILTVLVVNSNIEQIETNSADAGVYDCEYDLLISNNSSLVDFESNVDIFINYLRTH
jgi:hypothetical protein